VKLTAGVHLGPYEILAPLGAGGMGEVYSARDTRLGRTVAVKILPGKFADDAKLKIRFENEAKAISALSHPHICALYDVGPDYLVMEYCEGKTLAQRIAHGPLPIEQVIDYGIQIAGALEKAHRSGIIHRDLKPSNIIITKSGLKLLDFGLATQHANSPPDVSTEEGKIAGTVQYLAPELLHGKQADARSDIFALGLVLYEMAAGKPAFSGTSKASVIAAILDRHPAPVESSAPLDRIIRSCMAKDPDERIQNANDVKLQLRWLADDKPPEHAHMPRRRRAVTAALVGVLLVAAAAIVAAVVLQRRLAVAEQPIHTALVLPKGMALAPIHAGIVALSPDGRRVAMTVGTMEKSALAVSDLRTGETKMLAGSESATYPFWSPDSRQIGFFAQGKLKTIEAGGGAVQILCDVTSARGGAWSTRGAIVFTPGAAMSMFKVSEGGGTPVAITNVRKGRSHRFPSFLPDGRTFLYVEQDATGIDASTLYAGSIDGNLEKRIIDDASNAAFVDGRLLFIRNRNLVAQQFDAAKLAVSGVPVPIGESVEFFRNRDLGNFSATAQRLVYIPAVTVPRQIVSVDPKSGLSEPIGAPGQYDILDLSRDGRKIALRVGADPTDIWIMQLDRGIPTRVTFTNAYFISGVFSPDGNRLAYTAAGGGAVGVIIQSLDSNAAETVLKTEARGGLTSWSADGRQILIDLGHNEKLHSIDSLDIRQHRVTPLLASAADELDPVLSPDDRWLAYSSDASGSWQIYITPFPALDRKWQISSDIGTYPWWSPDGRKIFFIGRGKLNVVEMRDGTPPEFSVPSTLPVSFDETLNTGYAVTPGGKIITTRPAGEPVTRSIHLITNWTTLLPR